MKDVKGEAAFDAFVELIEPIYNVSQDEELIRLVREERVSVLRWLTEAIKRHKKVFMDVLSVLTEADAEEMDFLAVYRGVSELLENNDLLHLFMPQSQKTSARSGSASENTTASKA